jgi:polyribonucleotide nucleotidyltransferase
LASAIEKINGLTAEVVIGEIYEGEVKRIEPFGAFVEVLPGKDGLVHISRMGAGFVNNPEEVVKLGQKVKVKVTEIDDRGRINLTMLLNGEKKEDTGSGDNRPRRDFRTQPSNRGRESRFSSHLMPKSRFSR